MNNRIALMIPTPATRPRVIAPSTKGVNREGERDRNQLRSTPTHSKIADISLISKEIDDPWSILEAGPCRDFQLAIQAPSSDLCFAARGEAIGLALGPSDGWSALAELCSHVAKQRVEGAGSLSQRLPIALVSLAYDTAHGDEPWDGWAAIRAIIPRWLAVSSGRNRALLVTRATREGRARSRVDLPAAPRPTAPAPSFHELVNDATAAINAQQLSKVVVARARVEPWHVPFSPLAVARALARRAPNSTTFLWQEPERGAFVGATPELLVRVEGRRLHTHALAGTVARGSTEQERRQNATALHTSGKDRHEHDLVVQGIREALQPYSTALHAAHEPEVVLRGAVQHLRTPIVAELRPGVTMIDAVRALHPTPALGGFPREAARNWLREHEGIERGRYAAPFGWLTRTGGEFYVAIRSALLRDDRAWLYAGAGIVRGSEPDREFEETELKLDTMQRALREAQDETRSAL